MSLERPDMAGVAPHIVAYIEALEAEIAGLRGARARGRERAAVVDSEEIFEPSEPPTTRNLITFSAGGLVKRTSRHLYDRQRRAGMGIFDLDTAEEDPPAFLTIADQSQTLVLVTSQGRAFPIKVGQLPESPVRARGQSISKWLPLLPDERLALIFPDQGSGYLILVSQRGQVRRLRYHYFGDNLQPGTLLYDVRQGGAPAAWCWSAGDADLFIATARGNGIRFTEAQVPVRGCLGIRVDPDDAVVGVAAVNDESGVFLLGADGKGTIRLMSGFTPNKTPGSGGKVALKADRLVGAARVGDEDDIFIISRLSKLIRFRAAEIPAKEGVVQGVNCMALRGDETTALAVSDAGYLHLAR